jgi:8-oxo-dGTP pyrophosphatase MutT (NUDIX family)
MLRLFFALQRVYNQAMIEQKKKRLFTMDIKNYDPQDTVFQRPSMRAIVCMDAERLLMVYSTKKKYYKFPGGGKKAKETAEETLQREVKEETGALLDPQTIHFYGTALCRQRSEIQEHTIFEQENSYYTASLLSRSLGEQELDAYEAEDGFMPRFATLAEAIETNKKCTDLNDMDLGRIERDTRVLEILGNQEQVPSIAMAEFLVREAEKRNPGPWTAHSFNTAKCAQEIALKHPAMDPEKAYVMGLLHDIGRREGITGLAHVWDGYTYLKELGYDSCARIALTHSFCLKDLKEYVGKFDVSQACQNEMQQMLDSMVYDDYDRLIQLCDAMAMADKITTVEERMSDVKRRYGSYPQEKWDKNLELRDYFLSASGKIA